MVDAAGQGPGAVLPREQPAVSPALRGAGEQGGLVRTPGMGERGSVVQVQGGDWKAA